MKWYLIYRSKKGRVVYNLAVIAVMRKRLSTNDEAGDARLVSELKRTDYDGVAIGGCINGQDAVNFPATEETTVWFNRILNIIHANAPSTKIILVRGPEDVVSAIERVLGKSRPSRIDSDHHPTRAPADVPRAVCRCRRTLCCLSSRNLYLPGGALCYVLGIASIVPYQPQRDSYLSSSFHGARYTGEEIAWPVLGDYSQSCIDKGLQRRVYD